MYTAKTMKLHMLPMCENTQTPTDTHTFRLLSGADEKRAQQDIDIQNTHTQCG